MKEDSINYKGFLLVALKYWYLFVIIFPLCLGLAYYKIKSTPPSYRATSMLLIKDDEKSGQQIEEAVFKEMGLSSRNKKIENEVFILRSIPLMKRVIETGSLNYLYYTADRFKKNDLYNQSPVKVVNWLPKEAGTYLSAELHFERNNYKLVFDKKTARAWGGKREFRSEFGKELDLPLGKISFAKVSGGNEHQLIYVDILPVEDLAKGLVERLDVTLMSKESSTLQLTIEDEVPERAKSILTELVAEYNNQSVEDKNLSYRNSLDLITERINLITEELSAVEQNVENYKRQNSMVAISAEGSMLMQQMADYNKSISTTDVQLEILKTIEDFLVKNQTTFEFVPTNLSITNLTLTSQLVQFNKLLEDRARLKSIAGNAHPDVILAERQIQNLRQTIIENIRGIKSDLDITRNASNNLRNGLESRIQSLPRQERELVDIERRKGVKETLYLYLLQKREEAAISMAITVPTGKVVEPAEVDGKVSPKVSQIGLIAIFLGLALPVGLGLLIKGMNNKIQVEEDDLEKLTAVPVVGMLAESTKKGSIVVKDKSRSIQTEMFRLLRANLAYIASNKGLKSLLITSSMPGEGKSYVALNLAIAQALTGKKVVLLELDLRKPKQEQYAGMNPQEDLGVVNYLINPALSAEDVIKPSDINPNFDIIKCGVKPPNPGELILSPRLFELVEELRQLYDFIIIDTPPVGLVADALQMKDLADASMYVVRNNYTRRVQLGIIKDIAQKKKLPNPFIVLNSVNLSKLSGYGYTNGYGYTYGYGYVTNSDYFEKEA